MHFPRRADRLGRELDRLRLRIPRRRVPVPETPHGLAEAVGLELDDWQGSYLENRAPRRLLNCTRQAGKSTVAALDALHDALTVPGALILIVAPSERQSLETFRKVSGFYGALGHAVPAESERKLGLELLNGSRIEALPGSEKTTRGFSAPRRIIGDEASRIPDELYTGVLPMLARSGGALDLLSTPAGKQGFFYDAYSSGAWASWEVPATEIPHRIPPAFLEEMRATMDRRHFEQEFLCRFLDVEDAVFSGELIEAAAGYGVRETGGILVGGLMRYWTALDCGQAHDYSAALVSERVGDELHVTSLDRAPLRTPYPAIARAVVQKCAELEPVGAFGERREIGLIVDSGGVGRAVADLIREEIKALPRSHAPKIKFWPVAATAGGRVTVAGGFINVPKRDLITAAVVALQDGRLKIGDVPNAGLLTDELSEYRSKLTRRGHETFEGGGRNDDLVYALALACWAWSRTPRPPDDRRRPAPQSKQSTF